tara:strand:+ start:1387 stop:1800 length:414 start_codon:yes stop_codon:yes gene_type:complete
MKKISIYTDAAKKHIPYGLNFLEAQKQLQQQNKNTPIYIYDITHNPTQKKNTQTYVNDHINKTGANILINLKKQTKFYDLTTLYKQHKGGIITSCLGKKYLKNKHKHKNPSTTLCDISVFFKSKGFNQICGILINEK